MRLIDKSFTKAPGSYITQSLMAVVATAVILYFVESLTHTAIIAALGSSTFIVFAMPKNFTAQPRRLIGGHVLGLLAGLICYYAFLTGPLGELSQNMEWIIWLAAALSVGLAIFLMTIFDAEHPPAAGTALGIVAHAWTYQTIIFVLAYAISLALVRRLLRNYLRDLV